MVNVLEILIQGYAIDDNSAFLVLLKMVDTANQGGFSGAGRAADNDSLSLVYGKIDIFEYVKINVPFIYLVKFDNNFAGNGRRQLLPGFIGFLRT
jgi:hypothetical protein